MKKSILISILITLLASASENLEIAKAELNLSYVKYTQAKDELATLKNALKSCKARGDKCSDRAIKVTDAKVALRKAKELNTKASKVVDKLWLK